MSLSFDEINDITTDTVNAMLAPLEAKEKARNYILDMVALACVEYEKNSHFRKEINTWLHYRKQERSKGVFSSYGL